MESRKLKRYDSAPIATGASSSSASAAAARAAAHISNIPRPQAGSPGLQTSASKPTINASASTTSGAAMATTTASDPYEKQLEAYYRCMEEDNQALMTYYETHTMDIASLKVLAHERKYKEAVMQAMEAKTAAMDTFLQELMDIAVQTRGLRSRGDANTRETASNASVKSSHTSNTVKSATPISQAVSAPTMAHVREAVLKLQATLQATTAAEAKQQLTIQALEKEVAEWKEKAKARSNGTRSGVDNSTDEDHCFLPGTAKELREAQRKVRDLERRLTAATAEARDAAAAVKKVEQEQRITAQTLLRREDELAAMRALLTSKDDLLAAVEEEAKTARFTGASAVSPRAGSAAYVRTNSAPAGAAQHHRVGGETSSDRLVVTHHYRLLGGQRFVEGQAFSAESFKDALLRSISTMLHVPYGYLSSVELRTHAEAVSIELDIRHSSRMKEDEIDFLLLSHDYPEVMAYLDKVKTELAAQRPQDRNAARVRELQTALAEKDHEVAYLRKKLRALEESVERRDTEREVMDKDVDAALQETESTVHDLYEALQAAQLEKEEAQKALSVKALQARVAEQAKDAVVNAAAAAERALKEDAAKLREQLAQAQVDLATAQDNVVRATAQAQADEKTELSIAAFVLEIAVSTSSAQRAAMAAVLQDAQQTRVLHALILAHAGRTGGAVPVKVKSCVVSDKNISSSSSSSSDGATSVRLTVTVELAFFANKRQTDALRAEVQRKLKEAGNSCTSVLEYIRMRVEAARKEAAMTADAQRAVSEAEQRATAAIAAMRAETTRAHETKLEAAVSQLQEITARVASVVPSTANQTSVVSRVDQLLIRLTTAEAAARRHEEEGQRALRRLTETQQEREQLQQTLSELTVRCTEVRLAKEQLGSRLATTESQLKALQTAAGESEGALGERVRRLETALRAKTAAADAEKERLTEELKAAQLLAASRLVEAEEALAAREKEMKKLQANGASTASAQGSANEEAALREALRVAKEDRAALIRQVKEVETDMNDLSNIQASMQRELEAARQELRAKKHDFDLLVKQLIRMEEREKKWQADVQQSQDAQQQQKPKQPASPDSPSLLQDEQDAEKDDVARESLVVLTNSNTNLQQCLRRIQRAANAMGKDIRVATSSSNNNSNNSSSAAATAESSISGGARRSGHRKGALSATVSRAAMDHQQLSAQLTELLFPLLGDLERNVQQSGGAAFARTASGHSNYPRSSGAAATATIVKQHLSGTPFARTRSTPVVVERVRQDPTADDAAAADASKTQCETPTKSSRTAVAAAYGSPTVMGSGGKATVDAAPRLDFHRQASGRAFMRSNTASSATPAAGAAGRGSDGGGGVGSGLPPASGSVLNSTLPRTDAEKERRSRELPQRRTGSGASTATTASTGGSHHGSGSGHGGAAVSGGSYANAPRRYTPSSTTTTATTTTKCNPFRRSNTATTGGAQATPCGSAAQAGAAAFLRGKSGYHRMPPSAAETGNAGSGSTQEPKPYRMRF